MAAATGLSPKTVRNHLARLVRREAIYVVGRLGSLSDSGEIVYHILVSGTVPYADVRRVMGDAVLIHETVDPPRQYLFCRAESLGDLTARTHALENLSGVSGVQVTMNRQMFIGTGYMHRLVAERIKNGR